MGILVLCEDKCRQDMVGQDEIGFTAYKNPLPVSVYNKKPPHDGCAQQGGGTYPEYNFDNCTNIRKHLLQGDVA